jgi:hypothetical protein
MDHIKITMVNISNQNFVCNSYFSCVVTPVPDQSCSNLKRNEKESNFVLVYTGHFKVAGLAQSV